MHDNIISKPRVGLFVTCLVDLFRPTVGFAAIRLIEQAGCTVDVPAAQTCCGQPAYNSGDRKDARAIAENTIAAFEEYDYVVAPSGSCAGMLKKHYPGLFRGDAKWEGRAAAFAAKVHELVSFLADERGDDGGAGEASMPAPPIMIPARACANWVSGSSRARSCRRSKDSRCPNFRMPMPAAASAAPSASNIPKSPTPSWKRRPATSRQRAPSFCLPATSAA